MVLKKLKLKAKNHSLKNETLKFHATALFFLLCSLCLSATAGYAETSSKQFAAQIDKEFSELLTVKDITTSLNRQLWQARITNPQYAEADKGKNDLRQIIKQIKSIAFKPQSQTHEPIIVVEPIQKADPNIVATDAEIPQEIEPSQVEHELPDKQVTDQTLQIFKKLSQNPDQLQKPLELAEILFASNCLKEAASCYQQALTRMTTKHSDQTANKKAWILFQTGNCLRKIDPPQAMQMYKQLIIEYPNSPWTDLAKIKTKLIIWYLKDKPNTLIKKRKLPIQ